MPALPFTVKQPAPPRRDGAMRPRSRIALVLFLLCYGLACAVILAPRGYFTASAPRPPAELRQPAH